MYQFSLDIQSKIESGQILIQNQDIRVIDFIYKGIRVTQKPLNPLYQKYNDNQLIKSDYIERTIIIHYDISNIDEEDSSLCTCPNPETCMCDCCKQRRETLSNPDFDCSDIITDEDNSYSEDYNRYIEMGMQVDENILDNYEKAARRGQFIKYLMDKQKDSMYIFVSIAGLIVSNTINFSAPERSYSINEIYKYCIYIIDAIFSWRDNYLVNNGEEDSYTIDLSNNIEEN